MKRPSDNENPGPSRVNRPTGSRKDNRGEVGEMPKPAAPATSSSTSCSSTDTEEEVGGMSWEPSFPATYSLEPITTGRATRAERAEAELSVRTNEALALLQLVKDTFNNDEDKYRAFVELLKGYKEGRIDTPGVMTRVKELFKGHAQLLLRWFVFLRLRKDEAVAYLQLVKDTFNDDGDKYRDFVALLKGYKERRIDLENVILRIIELFKGHLELLQGWFALVRLRFHQEIAYFLLVRDTFYDDKDKFRDFMELSKIYKEGRIDIPGLITRVQELFKGHPLLVLGFMELLIRLGSK